MWERSADSSSGVSNGIKGMELQNQALQMQFSALLILNELSSSLGLNEIKDVNRSLLFSFSLRRSPNDFCYSAMFFTNNPVPFPLTGCDVFLFFSFNFVDFIYWLYKYLQAYYVVHCSNCWAYRDGQDQLMEDSRT